ncbi:MAG: AMIN domain-containing protein [Candidatus Dadabacteria bacterium]|nr:MAG: AMIN domain-containing protein [Candidatus Dadabacteria bacterium]
MTNRRDLDKKNLSIKISLEKTARAIIFLMIFPLIAQILLPIGYIAASPAPERATQTTTEDKSLNQKVEFGGIEIMIKGNAVFVRQSSEATFSPKVFEIDSPKRLVIDFKGTTIKRNKSFIVKNEFIKKIRYGVHPDMSRIVFDLKKEQAIKPTFKVLHSKKSIEIFFNDASALASTGKKTQMEEGVDIRTKERNLTRKIPLAKNNSFQPVTTGSQKVEQDQDTVRQLKLHSVAKRAEKNSEATPSKGDVVVEKPKEVERINGSMTLKAKKLSLDKASHEQRLKYEASSHISQTSTDTKARIKVTKAEAENKANKADVEDLTKGNFQVSVRDISFSYEGEGKLPVIKISLTERAPYAMLRTGQRAYRLTIPKAQFGNSNIALPHFPPQDFTGVTLINPEQNGDKVELFIGVDRGTKLISFLNGKEIWIKVAH